jgi:hypothetical protein
MSALLGHASLDARVQHLHDLLLLEGLGHLRAQPLDEERPVAVQE